MSPSMGTGPTALSETKMPGKVTNFQVAKCKRQSVVVGELFRLLHKVAAMNLERASSVSLSWLVVRGSM
jgi:hypothetical protein